MFDSFFVNSYPRSGNTWARLALIETLKAKALDLNPVFEKRYRLYFASKYAHINGSHNTGWIFKSHLKYDKMPQDINPYKGIYLVRDGRDSLVSYYFYNVKHLGYTETWSQFYDRYFIHGKYNSYREKVLLKVMGSWHENVKSYLQRPNALVMKYEDLLADPVTNFKTCFDHLEIDFNIHKDNLISVLNASKEKLEQKKTRDKEERKRGASGGWQNFFTDLQLDQFINRAGSTLQKTGYKL